MVAPVLCRFWMEERRTSYSLSSLPVPSRSHQRPVKITPLTRPWMMEWRRLCWSITKETTMSATVKIEKIIR